MKSLKSGIVIFILSVLLLVAYVPAVHAQTLISSSFSSSTYYQGDTGSITFTIRNDHSYQICTKETYIQFDWQQSQSQAFIDSTDTPCLATGNTYTFTIQFSIPSDESVGSHSYTVAWVDSGLLLGTQTLISSNLYVHDAEEKVYNNLYPQVDQAIQQGQSANYRSPTAQADLSQAVSYYSQGSTLANQGDWSSAVSDMNQAQSYAAQAYSAEQAYNLAQAPSQTTSSQSSGGGGIPEFPFVFPVVVITVVLVSLSYLFIRRRTLSP